MDYPPRSVVSAIGRQFSAVPAGTISVEAIQPWTDTGIDVSIGSTVTVSASGRIFIAGSDPGKTPAGDVGCVQDSFGVAPGLTCNALIGKIGNASPFLVGAGTTITAESSGCLYLGVNDRYGYFDDNRGFWSATISVTGDNAHELQTLKTIDEAGKPTVGACFDYSLWDWGPFYSYYRFCSTSLKLA